MRQTHPLLLVFTLCVLSCVHFGALSQNTGFRLVFTEHGIQNAIDALEEKVTSYIRSLEPLKLGSQGTSGIGYTFNLSKLSLFNSTHSGFNLTIVPGTGLRVELDGFGALFSWELDYTVGLVSGSFSSVGQLSDTTISAVLGLSESGGVPQFVVVDDELSVGSLDVGTLPGILEFAKGIINGLLELVINTQAPGLVKNILTTDVTQVISQNWNNGTQLIGGEILVNYTLTEPPFFGPTFFSISLDGTLDFQDSGIPLSSCPYTRAPLPPASSIAQECISVTLDISSVQCFLFQFISQQIVARQLSFHGLLGLKLFLAEPLVISVVGDGFSLLLPLEVSFSKMINGSPQKWVSVAANASLSLMFDFQLPQVTIKFPPKFLQVTGLGVPDFNAGIPQRYQDQILNQNWNNDLTVINNLIQSKLNNFSDYTLTLPDLAAEALGVIGNVMFQTTLTSLTFMFNLVNL